MDRIVLVPGQTVGGAGACAHVVVLPRGDGTRQCTHCGALVAAQAA